MTTDITVTLSRRTSAFGIVKAVEKALMDSPDYQHPSGCATIFVVQALPYHVGTHSHANPWSPSYPTAEQAAARIFEHTGIKVVLE